MSASTQTYTTTAGTYSFSSTGRPHYSESATFEAAERRGLPRRRIVRHRIAQWFKEPGWADNQARYAALRTALSVAEGVLVITDEAGNARVNRRVRVLTSDLPEQWGQHMAEVRVEFESVEEIALAGTDATFTPDAGSAVTLGDVRDWRQGQSINRYSELVPNRRESRLTIAARGSIRATPSDAPANRRAALLAQAALLRGLDKKDGVLAWGAFSERVRVTQCDADLGDGTDELAWSMQAEMLTFPSGDYAEAEFESAPVDDTENNERTTRVQGVIRAHDEAAALAKRDAIKATYDGGTRLYKGGEWKARKVDGADGATVLKAWDFSLAYREPLPDAVASYRLKVTSRTDETTGLVTITYSGRVTAADTADALAKARNLGQDKHDMKLTEEEDVGTVSLEGSAEQHTEVVFSYSYQTRGTELHAEVSSEVSRDRFGANVQTVSGYAVGADASTALTFARTFKVTGVLVQSEREGDAESYHAAAQLFQRVTFTYVYKLAAATSSIEYTVRAEDDFAARETVTTYTGIARAVDSSTADALITSLVGSLTGRWVVNVRESRYLSSGGQSVFDGRTFTVSKAAAISNDEDILDAKVTVTTTASIAMAKFTLIPFGTPHLQSDVGQTTGTVVATGSVTAVSLATAKSWARQWFPGGGYTTQQPSEAISENYRPRTGENPVSYTVQFHYPVEKALVEFV